LPIIGATWGGRAGALLTLLGCVVRYFTFQSYYDAGKRYPRKEAGLACRNCFIWGLSITILFRTAALIVNNKNLQLEQKGKSSHSSPFTSDVEWNWSSSADDDSSGGGGFSYRSIGSVSLPSFFK